MAYNKNEDDPPPAFNIDLTPSAPPNAPLNESRWYQAEWATDTALFANAAGRTAQNFWTDGLLQSQTRNFRVTIPGPDWDRFKAANRHLFFRIGAGTANDMSDWDWSVTTDILINHNPSADAGTTQRVPVAPGGALAADIVLDGSASTDPDAGSVLAYGWRLTDPLSIAGYVTSDVQAAAVTIDQFSAVIDRRRSTSFQQLWVNAQIFYEATGPEPPDEILPRRLHGQGEASAVAAHDAAPTNGGSRW